MPLDQVILHAPIPRPGKILALGLNYADHIEESKEAGLKVPTEQVWFCKQPTSVNDPDGDVELPKVSDMLDYEVELVAVIGRRGRHISREDAPAQCLRVYASATTSPSATGNTRPRNGCWASHSTPIAPSARRS